MAGAAPFAAAGASAVSAFASIRGGQAAADAARAGAITAASQAETARTIGAMNAGIIEAQGAYNAAEIERRAEFNATQIDRQVGDARTDLVLRERQARLAGEFLIADQRARVAAAGVTFEGSPLEVLSFQAAQNELEALTLRTRGNAEILDLMASAEAVRDAGAADVIATRFDTAMRALSARATGQVQAAGYQSQVPIFQNRARAEEFAGYAGAATDLLNAGSKALGGPAR